MVNAVPRPEDMFSDAGSPVALAQRLEQYSGALEKAHTEADQGGRAFMKGVGIVENPGAKRTAIEGHLASITKSVGVDAAPEIQAQLDALKSTVMADMGKDWTLTFPNSTGLVPYDLEAPAKLLVPRLTPLRNRVARDNSGQGTARQFKRILGWSNAGVGGVADMSPFMNSQTVTETFGPMTLRRGKKINYASDSKSVSYVEQSLSDQVNWVAEFAGRGFQSARGLSQTALLWAHLGGEERAMLYARGSSGNGYAGNIAAPTIAGSTSASGGTIAAGTYNIVVTAKGGFGETAVSNTVAQVTTGATSTITVNVTAEPTGSLGIYRLYVSQAGGAVGTATFQQEFVGNTVTITAPPTSTGAVNAGATNTSSDTAGYDGFLTVQSDPAQTGYFNRQNAALNAANPGDEFQTAFMAMYQLNKADPDMIYADATVLKKLGDLLKTTSSASYKLNLDGDSKSGHFLGSTVVGLLNQVTQKMVDLELHPWMPQGCALIRSETLPIPDSEVSETAKVVNVQEYMSIDWPVVQFTYDSSTYQFGTLVHYAPAWSGLIAGIK